MKVWVVVSTYTYDGEMYVSDAYTYLTKEQAEQFVADRTDEFCDYIIYETEAK